MEETLQAMARAEGSPESKVALTAVAFSIANKAISAKEKAKTILRYDKEAGTYVSVDAEREFRHIKDDIGTLATAVPDYGEDPVTAAVLAIVNLALLYHVNLDEITGLAVGTESSKDKSKNMAIQILHGVNKASAAIYQETGIYIGRLKGVKFTDMDEERKKQFAIQVLRMGVAPKHLQDACAPVMEYIKYIAEHGLNLGKKELVVGTDLSSYQLHKPEDETGTALGAVAMLLEPLTDARGRGFKILSSLQSEAYWDSTEFTKELLGRLGDSGLAVINEDPIVYGWHSNYSYMYLVFRAMRDIFTQAGLSINSIRDTTTNLAIFLHGPYESIHAHALAYFIRHLAHSNSDFAEELAKEAGHDKEPFLPGFYSLEKEFKFLHKLSEVYLKFAVKIDGIERLRMHEEKQDAIFVKEVEARYGKELAEVAELLAKHAPALLERLSGFLDAKLLAKLYPKQSERLTKELEENMQLRAEDMTKELRSIAQHNELKGDESAEVIGLIEGTADRLQTVAELGGTIRDIIVAFSKLNKYVGEFEKRDYEYNQRVIKTNIFDTINERLQIKKSDKLLKIIGNLDTASAPLNFAALVAFGENLSRVLGVGYGSGSHAPAFLMEAMEYQYMREAIMRNIIYELGNREYVDHEWYAARRLSEGRPNTQLVAYRLDNSINFNTKVLAEMARSMYNSEKSAHKITVATKLRSQA